MQECFFMVKELAVDLDENLSTVDFAARIYDLWIWRTSVCIQSDRVANITWLLACLGWKFR